jgi:hypothetical protein
LTKTFAYQSKGLCVYRTAKPVLMRTALNSKHNQIPKIMNNMYVTTYRVMGQNFTIETTEKHVDKAKAMLDKMIVGGYVFISHLPAERK